MKGRLLGCALMLFAGVLLIAWWLPKTHTAFWLILIVGLALWIGGGLLALMALGAIVRFRQQARTA